MDLLYADDYAESGAEEMSSCHDLFFSEACCLLETVIHSVNMH